MIGYGATPEVLKAMLAKAEEKLTVAHKNLNDKFYGEVSSRAYYAAFHAVSAVLASCGMVFSSHTQVIGAFTILRWFQAGNRPANPVNGTAGGSQEKK